MSFQTYNNTYLSPFHKIAYWLYEMIGIDDEMIFDKKLILIQYKIYVTS